MIGKLLFLGVVFWWVWLIPFVVSWLFFFAMMLTHGGFYGHPVAMWISASRWVWLVLLLFSGCLRLFLGKMVVQ